MKKILLVEDDQELVQMYKKKLEIEGYETSTAADGEEGLKAAHEKKPDLILLDIAMPKMDGITMMKKLRTQEPWGKTVPIIILTNMSLSDDILNAVVQNEPSYYILKADYTPAGVVDKIKSILNG